MLKRSDLNCWFIKFLISFYLLFLGVSKLHNMDPETLAAPCTNSMLEPFRRAIEAAVPGPSPPPPGLPDPNFNVANFTTYNKYHCNVDLVFSFNILFPLFVDCCVVVSRIIFPSVFMRISTNETNTKIISWKRWTYPFLLLTSSFYLKQPTQDIGK